MRSEAVAIDQLAFEGGEETLAHRIVVGVADRARRWTNPGLLAAITESNRRVLRASVRVMDDVVGLSGRERHVESVEHDAGLQIGREGPSDDPARPGVENDREVEKTALVKAATFSPELADLTMTAPSIESWRDAQHAHCAPHAGT